jgi:hypothetical protein
MINPLKEISKKDKDYLLHKTRIVMLEKLIADKTFYNKMIEKYPSKIKVRRQHR